jgi:hypothetical protein
MAHSGGRPGFLTGRGSLGALEGMCCNPETENVRKRFVRLSQSHGGPDPEKSPNKRCLPGNVVLW